MYRILLSLLVLTSSAQLARSGEAQITGQQQRDIVTELQRLIGEHYVLDEGARRLLEGLKQAGSRGEFDAPKPMTEFIKMTNLVLQQAFADQHLGVISPTRYQEMEKRFHRGETDPTAPPDSHMSAQHTGPPQKQGHAQHESHGATASGKDSSGHGPLGRGPSVDRSGPGTVSATGGDVLLEVAGVFRVAEINRDGLNQIGYLALQRFDGSPRAVAAIDRILHSFTDSDRLIIDLRESAGGDVEMVKVLGSYLFAERTHLVSSIGAKGADGQRPLTERWTTPNALSARYADKPVDVLISKKTFSAAESFAFGLKITGRARLIGEPSGGGGHMNDFYPLPSGLGASISVGRTYDPRTGKGWEAEGVVPDVLTHVDHALSDTIALITRESGKLSAMNAEQTAIYAQIQDYANAWYGGDAARMAELLASDFQASHEDGSRTVHHRDRSAQIAATEAGIGVRPQLYHNRIISQIEVTGAEASARLVLRETIHQLRLRRTDTGWVLVFDEFRDKLRHG